MVDARGELLAYIEADGTVGAPDLEYLGEVTAPNEASKGFVTDKDDVLIAEVDYGLGLIRDAAGSTIAALSRSGEVSGHYGARCGTLDGFTYAAARSERSARLPRVPVRTHDPDLRAVLGLADMR